MQQLVITAVGPDRPGLVDELTGCLHQAGANIADSRMINLRGQFALLLLAEVPDNAAGGIAEALSAAGKRIGLSVSVAPQVALAAGAVPGATPGAGPGAGAGAVKPVPGVPYRLRSYAMDQPGIVHRITHLLHRHGINIEELQTRLEAGSVSGTPLFTMELRMTVPTSVPIKTLRRDLEELCDGLNCDVDIDPA